MGLFRFPLEVADASGERFELTNPLVDTGALYSQLPAAMLARLGRRPNATRRFSLADGSIFELRIGPVPVRLNGEVQPVICIFAEPGAPELLGATTLDAFGLAPDPVNETLVPVIAALM